MANEFVLNAELRTDLGKGASRRLRHAGKVPAIIYGAGHDPVSLTLLHNELAHQLENEAFFSHILKVKIDGKDNQAIVKDLQRVSATEKIRVNVPIHFTNEEQSPGVREGGLITHSLTEVEVACLPADLPEYLEADLSTLELDGIYHMSDLKLAKGIELVELAHGESHDQAVASVHVPRAVKEEDDEPTTEESGEAVATEDGESSEPAEE